jgi:hypothetical protein
MYSVPKPIKLDIVTAIIATADFVGAVLHLSVTNFTPNQNTVLADFTEATFTGYAPSSAVVWGAPFLDAAGDAVSVGSAKTFVQTGVGVVNIVYTWYLETALGAYLCGGALDTPVNFAAMGDGVTLVPTFKFTGN